MNIHSTRNIGPLKQLALSFPSIALRTGGDLSAYFPSSGGFDASVFDGELGGSCSDGEFYAVQFVLHVWNGRTWPFELYAALPDWDPAHLKAWTAWAADPFYY